MIDPNVSDLAARVAEVAVKNTAEVIYNKISLLKAKKQDTETINTLTEIINELIADKNELINLSKRYEDELVAQQISDEDINYITEKLVPILKDFIEDKNQIGAIEALLSKETLKILQILGFNFKEAIGEPITTLVANFFYSKNGSQQKKQKK